MENPCEKIKTLRPCIRVIAKSTRRENEVKKLLNEVCGNYIQYQYWYGSGLWNVNIHAQEMDEEELTAIERIFNRGPTDSCMIFLDREKVFDNTHFRYYNSLEHQLFDVQPMEPPTGKVFNLKR